MLVNRVGNAYLIHTLIVISAGSISQARDIIEAIAGVFLGQEMYLSRAPSCKHHSILDRPRNVYFPGSVCYGAKLLQQHSD